MTRPIFLRRPVRTGLPMAAWLVCTPTAGVIGQTHLGMTAGVSWAGMHGTFVEGIGRELGAVLGFTLEREFASYWLVDLEVNFAQKGADNLALPSTDELIDFRYSYIEVPITLHRMFPISRKRFSINVYAGGALSFNGGCEIRFEDSFTFENCSDTSPGGLAEQIEPSLLIGTALRRNFEGGSRISLETRFSLGMATVPVEAINADLSARNNVLEFIFSFGLPLTGM